MGDGDGYSRPALDEDKVFDQLNTFRWINLIFHLVRLIMALATFGVCMWIRFDLDFRVWVEEIDWYTYWYCMYVIAIAMVCEVVVSSLGIYGVLRDGRGVLLFCMIAMGFLMFLEFTGGIIICIYGVEESPVLIEQLTETFLKLVYKWDVDARASKVLKQIMEYVGCCGSNGSEDFINALKPIPWECRDQVTGVEYIYGCKQQFAWWLEPWSASLAAIAFFYVATDIFGIWSNKRLRRHIHEFRLLTDED